MAIYTFGRARRGQSALHASTCEVGRVFFEIVFEARFSLRRKEQSYKLKATETEN
jgi:hypothetical protein